MGTRCAIVLSGSWSGRFFITLLLFPTFFCVNFAVTAAVAETLAGSREIVILQGTSRIGQGEQKSLAAFNIEIVSDPYAKEKGLSGRNSMPEDQGMLFILSGGEKGYFWMKDMRFPLDILEFDKEKMIVEIHEDVQPCIECPILTMQDITAYVIEINAGMAKKYRFQKGDRFELNQ